MAQWTSDATEATFEQEVLERSKSTPVLVDFWAEWCAPCRTLGPTLEAAVEARKGAVWLTKVNVDENPGLSAEFGIRGIPTVKAFFGGRFVGEFVGLRDRRDIDAFIDRLQPSAEEEAFKKAAALLGERRYDEALAALEVALASEPHRDAALLLVAQIQVARDDFAQARSALEQISAGSLVESEAQNLLVRIELMESGRTEDEERLRQRVLKDGADTAARWSLAGKLLARGAVDETLETLLEIVQADRGYREDGARRAMLSIFDTLGSDNDLTREYRRRLQIYV